MLNIILIFLKLEIDEQRILRVCILIYSYSVRIAISLFSSSQESQILPAIALKYNPLHPLSGQEEQ